MATMTCSQPLTSGNGTCSHKVTPGASCAAGHAPKPASAAPMSAQADVVAATDPMGGVDDNGAQGVPQRLADRVHARKPKIKWDDDWFTPCTKCAGTGQYGGGAYGTPTCFACKGTGRTFTKDGRKAAKTAKKAAAETARQDFLDQLASDPELLDIFLTVTDDATAAAADHPNAGPNSIHEYSGVDLAYPRPVYDIAWRCLGDGRMPTPKQVDFVKSKMAKHAEIQAKMATAKPAPEGKVTETFTIVKTDLKSNPYGPGLQRKMLVTHEDGYRVWMTIPAPLADSVRDLDELRGVPVRLNVELNPKSEDPLFAIGKRPKVAAAGDGWDDFPPALAHAARTAGADQDQVRSYREAVIAAAPHWEGRPDVDTVVTALLNDDTERARAVLPKEAADLLLGPPPA